MGFLLDGVIDALVHRRARRGMFAMRHFTGGGYGGRGSFLNTSTLLGAAGLAWGLYEVAQSKKSSTTSPSVTPPASSPSYAAAQSTSRAAPLPTSPPPLPTVAAFPSASEAGLSPEIATELRTARLLIAAARADGQIGEEELGHILEYAREAGVENAVREEWNSPRPLAQIVAGVSDPAHKRDLYTLAYGVLRADEDVCGAERIFLAQLAAQLGLDTQTTLTLERETDRSIDSARG